MVSSAFSFLLGSLAIGVATAKPVSTTTSTSSYSCVPIPTTVSEGVSLATFITEPATGDDDDATSLRIDFEDGSFDHWGIDADLGFTYDIKEMKTPKGDSKVFEILEPTSDSEGFAFINNDQVFKLEKSKRGYKVAFTAKCSWASQEGDEDWAPIGIILKHRGSRAFETNPTNGKALGDGWVRFEEEFLNEDITGDTTFTIRVKATGWSLDWYFDDIVVEKIE